MSAQIVCETVRIPLHVLAIIDLADSIKDALPSTELVLSTLITGSDNKDLERQVRKVNKILRQHSGNKC